MLINIFATPTANLGFSTMARWKKLSPGYDNIRRTTGNGNMAAKNRKYAYIYQ